MGLTSNGINSDSFSREDLITVQTVVAFINSLLNAYPIINQVNLAYNATTGIITANGLTALPGTGAAVVAGDATSSLSGGDVVIRGGKGSATKSAGGFSVFAGQNLGGGSGSISLNSSGGGVITVTDTIILQAALGGEVACGDNIIMSCGGPTSQIQMSATLGVLLTTDSGAALQITEPVGGGPQLIGFAAKADTPTYTPRALVGSRATGAAFADMAAILLELGLITANSTTA